MLFENIIQPDVKVGEVIKVQFFDGGKVKELYGVLSKIDKKHFYLKETKDSKEEIRFNLKLDKIVKMN